MPNREELLIRERQEFQRRVIELHDKGNNSEKIQEIIGKSTTTINRIIRNNCAMTYREIKQQKYKELQKKIVVCAKKNPLLSVRELGKICDHSQSVVSRAYLDLGYKKPYCRTVRLQVKTPRLDKMLKANYKDYEIKKTLHICQQTIVNRKKELKLIKKPTTTEKIYLKLKKNPTKIFSLKDFAIFGTSRVRQVLCELSMEYKIERVSHGQYRLKRSKK